MATMKKFYFSGYEDRVPEPPVAHSDLREFFWQLFASAAIVLGAWYLWWRWTSSLNMDAIWFSYPMVIAESCAYVGMLLFFHNLWKNKDFEKLPPPHLTRECMNDGTERPISVDLFLPTYDEDPELVRYSIVDAKNIRYPHPIEINIHVLDDGRREVMRKVADEEGVGYISRDNNMGFKAGNLRNAMEQTSGDFIVICDADTRPFPTMLENTMGYFRDPDVAWVQTPQWFYDIPQGAPLTEVWKKNAGFIGGILARGIEKIWGEIRVGEDPFINDPRLFYDVLLRRRNAVHGSFCCGAGSVHRREAVMEAALKAFGGQVDKHVGKLSSVIKDPAIKADFEEEMSRQLALETELTPYKFHVSEDIYTSIVLHSDPDRNWKSVLHPEIESKMLSPLDLQSWIVQRFKYAGGTIDIGINDNPIFARGMGYRQKLMYAMTFWSYLAPLWNVIFLSAPVIALFTGIAPVSAYSTDFFLHLLPFLLIHEIASILGMWGISNFKGRALNLAFFSTNLRAIWTVLRGRKISFPTTPKERQDGSFLHLVIPQLVVIGLTLAAIIYGSVQCWLNPTTEAIGMLVVNVFWGLNNVISMSVLVKAATWKPQEETVEQNAQSVQQEVLAT